MHGNGEDHTIFDVLVQQLSREHTVYAIDSRGHGKSSEVKILDYQTMMEDIAAFIKELDINKPVLYGFSDGGIIGILLAVKYPEVLSKLIISGVNTRPGGMKSFTLALMKIAYFFTRNEKLKLMLTQPDITKEELNKIVVPVLVLAGSNDIVKPKHTKMIAENINGSALKILEGENHASYVINSEKLYGIIKPFLQGVEFFLVRYIYSSEERFCLWYSDNEKGLWYSDSENGFCVDENKRIISFSNIDCAGQYLSQMSFLLSDSDDIVTYDFDKLKHWISNDKPATDCSETLNFWNLFSDVACSTDQKFNGDKKSKTTDLIYNKLFYGCNLPSVKPESEDDYVPVWNRKEIRVMKAVLKQGLNMFLENMACLREYEVKNEI